MMHRVVRGTLVICLAMLLTLCGVTCAYAATTKASQQDIPTTAQNGIPLLTIEVDESDDALAQANKSDPDHKYGTIADVNGSPDHTVRGVGSIRFDVPKEYKNEYGSTLAPQGEIPLRYFRGRGKGTWGINDKRPYRIQLREPLDLFGMGESSSWTLVANAIDNTLLRDRVAYWLGNQIGLSFTPQVVPVDVVIIGSKSGPNYLGSYTLSEAVRFGKDRIEVPELNENDVDENTITGGYLLSIYSDEDRAEPQSTYIKTNSGIQMLCEYPEFKTEDLTKGELMQRAYITDYLNRLDNLIMESGTIAKSVHDDIFALMDARSTADFWWMQEFTCNSDGYRTSSTYLYKNREDDTSVSLSAQGKLCWGPLWDFDMAWPEDYIVEVDESDCIEGFNHTKFPWLDRLREKDRRFVRLLKDRWLDPKNGMNVKLQELTADGGTLDRYFDQIEDSWFADFRRWYFQDRPDLTAKQKRVLFNTIRKNFKGWIDARRAWVNGHLDELGDVYYTMNYQVDGETYQDILARGNGYISYPPVAPTRDGMVFTGWKEIESGEDAMGFRPNGDTSFKATYIPAEDVVLPSKAFFPLHDYYTILSSLQDSAAPLLTVPREVSLETVRWTTSNASVAIVSAKGQPIALGVGDTTITASFPNGVAASYVLHVSEMSFYRDQMPEGLIDTGMPLVIEAGAVSQLGDRLTPDDRYYCHIDFTCSSSDPAIASIYDDQTRTIKGEAPGETTITITALSDDEPIFETTRTARVVKQGLLGRLRAVTHLVYGLRGAARWLVAAGLTAIIMACERLLKLVRGKTD